MARTMTSYNYNKGKIAKGSGYAPDIMGAAMHDTVTQTGVGTSDYVLIPDAASAVLCVVDPNTNTAKLQASCGNTEELAAGTAIWEDWDHGLVSGITSFIYGPVSAVRLVVGTGAATSTVQLRATFSR